MSSEDETHIADPLPGPELLATIEIVAPKWAQSFAESARLRALPITDWCFPDAWSPCTRERGDCDGGKGIGARE